MIRTIDASEWVHHEPEGKGKRSCLLPLPEGVTSFDFVLRSSSECFVNAISADGLTIFLDAGRVIHLNLKVSGISALEVTGSTSFCYRYQSGTKWYEKPDPIPLKVAVDTPANQAMQDLVKHELLKYLEREKARSFLKDDADIEEFVNDIYEGDLEFEDEERDPWSIRNFEEGDDTDEVDEEEVAQPDRPSEPAPAGAGEKVGST